jgi:ABC-type branched-subunit amino acid transport system substrate-binding protein
MPFLRLYLPAVLLFSSAVLTARVEAIEPSSKPFTVGFIGSLSGQAQIYGEASKNGLEMALRGMSQPKFTVIYEDDGFDPKRTISAFKKLVDVDGADAIITIGSTPSNAVAPLAEARRIPLLAWASDPRVAQGRRYAVRLYPSGLTEGRSVAAEAKRRGLSRVAIISSLNDYAHSWRLGLRAGLPESEIVLDEEVQPDAKDFRSLVVRAKHKHAEGFLICLNPGQNGIFAKQLAALGLASAQVGGCEYLHDKSENEVAGGALNGAWFVTVAIGAPFRAEYVRAYGDDQVLSGGACLHDAALLMQRALESEGTESLHFIERLKQAGSIRGALGEIRVIEDTADRYIDMPLEVRRVTASGSEFIRLVGHSAE